MSVLRGAGLGPDLSDPSMPATASVARWARRQHPDPDAGAGILYSMHFAGGSVPTNQLINLLAKIEGRQQLVARMRSTSAESARLFHETALTLRLCESKFGTVTQGGSGKKPGSTYMKQILHHLDVVDLIKLED